MLIFSEKRFGIEENMNRIRIGTRGSKLALQQASLVQEALQRADGHMETEIVILHTKGDRIQDKPLSELGDKGAFASELEQALLEERIDIAVHSAKDLPVVLAEGLAIAAVLPRADVRDVLVTLKGGRIPSAREYGRESRAASDRKENDTDGMDREKQCPFVIGTGSRRRQLQAGQLWKNVICENIRGNVDTRLRKLKEGGYDGIILAKAGTDRLGIGAGSGRSDEFLFCPLPPERFLPAACQGIIAVEAVQDSAAAALCREITDAETELCFLAEREVLARLSADCSEAAAAWCRRERGRLALDVMYAGIRQRLAVQNGNPGSPDGDAVVQAVENPERKGIYPMETPCVTGNVKKESVYRTETAAALEMARQAAVLVKIREKGQI